MRAAVMLVAAAAALFFSFLIFIASLIPPGALRLPNPLGAVAGQQGLPGVVCAPAEGAPGGPVAGFGPEQLGNAALIVSVGARMGVPQRGQVIAVATAMQESGLVNLNRGDRDSLGLFQQRPSQGWGSPAQVTNPTYAATQFYRRLLAVPGWQSLPLTVAAQKVQASGLPDAYAKWENKANQVVGAALHITCSPSGAAPAPQPGTPVPGAPAPAAPPTAPADSATQLVLARATSQVGQPYAWGGGNASGPSRGIPGGGPAAAADVNKVGFDCSGLMVYAFAAAGITVPHQTQAIWKQFQPAIVDRNQMRAGDMLLVSTTGSPSGISHVGLYLGGGRVIHAPESGTTVRVETNIWANKYWTTHVVGAVRPLATKGAKPLA